MPEYELGDELEYECGDTLPSGETYFCADCAYGVEADDYDEED